MFARVTTVFGVRDNASVIPEEAMVPQSDKQFVIKLLEGPSEATRTTQRVEVKVGLRSPGKVEILEGLAPGDTVVRTGQQRIQKDGTVVTVVDLFNGSAAGAAATDRKPAGGASAASVAPAASSVVAAGKAALSGPNPCGSVIPSAGLKPASSSAPAEPRPAPPAVRNPG